MNLFPTRDWLFILALATLAFLQTLLPYCKDPPKPPEKPEASICVPMK
jgi:hypothetical protein